MSAYNTEEVIINAVIEATSISTSERGFLDCWLTLDYGGSGQGFGGFVLYLPKSWRHHKLESVAGHFIFRVMEVAGVTSWDEMIGKTIRVKKRDYWGEIIAIGHIINDDWFNPREDFKAVEKPTETEGGAQTADAMLAERAKGATPEQITERKTL